MGQVQNNNKSVLKNVFNKDFIVSAIIPILIFTVFDKYGMTLEGIILTGVWSIGVVCINYVKEKSLNALATMSAVFAGIGLIGTVVSKNPTFYLIAPIVQDILFAAIFFGSLLFKRSLIQIIVEQSYLKNSPEEVKNKPQFKTIMKQLSIIWGFVCMSQALVRIILLYTASVSTYYAISTAYGNISTPVMIAFSIMFPKWYSRRSRQGAQN
ncbi:VC0807 family protein [Clostridium saccharoperbutylacetonicum]|uniref:VC0807 family protein n=1 Tax=Clostridium saccharoperbutylacetonicum TaxID=36745 RepID=UPI0039EB6473